MLSRLLCLSSMYIQSSSLSFRPRICFLLSIGIASLGLWTSLQVRHISTIDLSRRRSTRGPGPLVGNPKSLGITKVKFGFPLFSLLFFSSSRLHVRLDVTYDVRFYGQAERLTDGTGRATWGGGQEVLAVAYDVMIPGYSERVHSHF